MAVVQRFPNSSNVREGSWNAETEVIEITFKGGQRYAYLNCTEAEWTAISTAESVGKAVIQILKNSGKQYVRL